MGYTDHSRIPSGDHPPDFDYGMVPLSMAVGVDRDLGAVTIKDQTGRVSILLAPSCALQVALQLVAACGRLASGRAEVGQ
jgi:hypothetical protein